MDNPGYLVLLVGLVVVRDVPFVLNGGFECACVLVLAWRVCVAWGSCLCDVGWRRDLDYMV